MCLALKCGWYTQCNPLEKTNFAFPGRYQVSTASWLGVTICVHYSVMLHGFKQILRKKSKKGLDLWWKTSEIHWWGAIFHEQPNSELELHLNYFCKLELHQWLEEIPHRNQLFRIFFLMLSPNPNSFTTASVIELLLCIE